MALMRIDQTGLPPGEAGRARKDGKSNGSLVTLTDLTPGGTTFFEILWVDPADDSARQSLGPTADPHVWTFQPKAGVFGGIRIRLTHTTPGGTASSQVRILGIADSNGVVKPCPGERSDPNATIANATSPAVIDKCERNWPTADFPLGNPFGWGLEMNELLRGFEDAAQQSAIDELATEAEAHALAISQLQSAKTAHDAAITTVASVNTAQQAAIDSLTVAKNAHQTSIENLNQQLAEAQQLLESADAALEAASEVTNDAVGVLQTRASKTESLRQVHVLDFMSMANLQSGGLAEAVESAREQGYTAGTSDYCYDVKVPAGVYVVAGPIALFPATGHPKPSPGLIGDGIKKTIFRPTGLAQGQFALTCANAGDTLAEHVSYQTLKGFSIIGDGIGCGIKVHLSYRQLIEDVWISGFSSVQPYNSGIALDISRPHTAEANHQHPALRRVRLVGNQMNLKLHTATQCDFNDVTAWAAKWLNAVIGNSSGNWVGGDIQGSPMSEDPNAWYAYGEGHAGNVVSDFTYEAGLPSGSGATLSAASGGRCTLTAPDLAGLNAQGNYRGLWVRVTDPSPLSPDKVSGIYKIYDVDRATGTLTIWKGSSHTSRTVNWQLCGHYGNNQFYFDNLYDEGFKRSSYEFGKDVVTRSHYSFGYVPCAGSTIGVDVDGVSGSVVVHNSVENPGNIYIRARGLPRLYAPNITRSNILVDSPSRLGLACAYGAPEGAGATLKTLLDASGGSGIRVRDIAREIGAVAAWDARLRSTLTVASGTQLSAWADHIGGPGSAVFAPVISARPCVYTASDVGFEGPAVATVGGDMSVYSSLAATVPAARWPTENHATSIFAVLRLIDTGATNQNRGIALVDSGSGATLAIRLNDEQDASNDYYVNMFVPLFGNVTNTQLNETADTDPHAFATTTPGGDSLTFATDFESGRMLREGWGSNQFFGPGDKVITIGTRSAGGIVGAFAVAYLAVFPFTLSSLEMLKLIGAARNEWRKIRQ